MPGSIGVWDVPRALHFTSLGSPSEDATPVEAH